MPRYIFVSFVFMAWAFYELSGGADFQPNTTGTALIAQAQAETVKPVRKTVSPLKQAQVKRAKEQSHPQKIQPAMVTAAKTDGAAQIQPAVLTVASAEEPSLKGLSQFQGEALSSLNVASLREVTATSDGPSEPAQVRPEPKDDADMREIIASRVNMRAGPGTDNDIVDQLERGHTVEVLENDGRGWLRLRALPEDRVGWIAARLVSSAE